MLNEAKTGKVRTTIEMKKKGCANLQHDTMLDLQAVVTDAQRHWWNVTLTKKDGARQNYIHLFFYF